MEQRPNAQRAVRNAVPVHSVEQQVGKARSVPAAIIERKPGRRGRWSCWNWRRWDDRGSRRAGGVDHHARMLADSCGVIATSQTDEFWRRVASLPASWQPEVCQLAANGTPNATGVSPAVAKPHHQVRAGCQNHVRTNKAMPIFLD